MEAKEKQSRLMKVHLTNLTRAVRRYLELMDQVVKETPSPERGQRMARLSNALEMANDQARHFGLGEKL